MLGHMHMSSATTWATAWSDLVLLPCRVCACMQTQHKVQLDDRDQGGRVPQPMAVSSSHMHSAG